MKTDETDEYEDIAELARDYSEAAIQVLVDIMSDSDVAPSTRLSAAKTILEHGWGKPPARAKQQPRAAPINRVEWVIVDHKRPENRPEAEDASEEPASHQYGQSARPPVRARHDRQPGEDRLAQPP
jgi:hypothetical protein